MVNGEERMLSYASRTLASAEHNYCVTRREMLALIWFLKHFKPYLYGRRILIRTDHASLQWLVNFKEPENQVARWLEILQRYDYKIIHWPGKRHGNADGLSRQRCHQCGRLPDDTEPEQGAETLPQAVSHTSATGNTIPKQIDQEVRTLITQPKWTKADFRALQEQDQTLAPFLQALQRG